MTELASCLGSFGPLGFDGNFVYSYTKRDTCQRLMQSASDISLSNLTLLVALLGDAKVHVLLAMATIIIKNIPSLKESISQLQKTRIPNTLS